jgi:tRNA pseudouridine55 synthase
MLLADKPEGPTSHDVVDRVRRVYGVRKVGHAGTLDPFASGLLVLLLGRATRLARFVRDLAKCYEGVVRLGETTETDDHTGAVTRSEGGWELLSDETVQAAMASLVGRYLQRPPAFSAKKLDGERAYRRARRGEALDMPPVEVDVTAFEMTAREGADVGFRCSVGSGTYVRGLARDLGEALGCGGYLRVLRRTAVGEHRVEEAHTLDALAERPEPLPMLAAVAHLPAVSLSAQERTLAVHGHPLDVAASGPGPAALTSAGALVAVAEREADHWRPRVVVADA